jgi:ketosteroid isomerase-like protein
VSGEAEDVIRQLAAVINGDDPEGQTRVLHPEAVQYGTRGGIDQERVVRGREAVLEYWQETAEAWESQSFELERVIEAGDVAVAFWHETGRGRQSELEVENDTASIFRFRDGMIIELRGYLDRDEALRAAGVEE